MFNTICSAGSYATGLLLNSTTTVGGDNIKVTTAVDSTADLVDIFTEVGKVVGCVILAYAIVKLIMSYAEENPQAKMHASILLGTGIFLISLSSIVTMAGFMSESYTTASDFTPYKIAKSMLMVLQKLLRYSGVALLLMGVIAMIMSYIEENPGGHTKATTIIMVAAGLLSSDQIVDIINGYLTLKLRTTDDTDLANSLAGTAVEVVMRIGAVGGAIFLIYGVLQLIFAFKDEDAGKKTGAIKIMAVGAALLSPEIIFGLFF